MSYKSPEMFILNEMFISRAVCTSPGAFVEGGGGNYSDDAVNDNGSY